MLEHKLLACSTVHCKNGESYKIALVVTANDYVIANYYDYDKPWGSGDYYPLDTPLENMFLTYSKWLVAARKSIFTADITAD